MAIYWPTPGLKGRTFKLCVLTRWDFNFCVRSSSLRGFRERMRKNVSIVDRTFTNRSFSRHYLVSLGSEVLIDVRFFWGTLHVPWINRWPSFSLDYNRCCSQHLLWTCQHSSLLEQQSLQCQLKFTAPVRRKFQDQNCEASSLVSFLFFLCFWVEI